MMMNDDDDYERDLSQHANSGGATGGATGDVQYRAWCAQI